MNKTKIAIALLVAGLASTNLYATNGYFSHGYGAKEKGMAGAGNAKAGNSISSANNPAGLLQIGDSMDAGASIFSPVRSITVTGGPAFPVGFTPVIGSAFLNCNPGQAQPVCQVPFSHVPGTVDSTREWFLIPSFGYSSRIDEKSVWGISIYGNGGMNSTYNGGAARFLDPATNTIVEAPGVYGAGKAGVDLSQLFINTTYAHQISDAVGVGVSLIAVVQTFAATGLAPFKNNSLYPDKLTNNGHDYATGFGVKIGMNIELSDAITLGISYQSKMSMSKFDDYAGLFADKGSFDIPSSYTIGLAIKTSDTSTLLIDYQAINYTDVAAISNSISSLLSPATCTDSLNNTLTAWLETGGQPQLATGSGCLGGANGAGFGWNDISVIKLGYEWSMGKDTYRIGFSTTDQPIDTNELNFNILAPGVVEDHFTAGYTSNSGDNEWTVFFLFVPEVEVTGPSQFDPTQTITIRMNQFEFGFEYKF